MTLLDDIPLLVANLLLWASRQLTPVTVRAPGLPSLTLGHLIAAESQLIGAIHQYGGTVER